MDDPARMRGPERRCYLDRVIHMTSSSRNGPLFRRAASVSPSQYSMTRCLDAVLATDVEQRADVRVVQAGDGARFTLEPKTRLRVVRDRRRDDLDGHRAIELDIDGLVNLAHAAGADADRQTIRTDTPPFEQTGPDGPSKICNGGDSKNVFTCWDEARRLSTSRRNASLSAHASARSSRLASGAHARARSNKSLTRGQCSGPRLMGQDRRFCLILHWTLAGFDRLDVPVFNWISR